jgi:hypothetical protein
LSPLAAEASDAFRGPLARERVTAPTSTQPLIALLLSGVTDRGDEGPAGIIGTACEELETILRILVLTHKVNLSAHDLAPLLHGIANRLRVGVELDARMRSASAAGGAP